MFSKSVFRRPGVTRHFCNQFAINAGLPEPYELDQPSDGGRPGAGAGASRLDKDVIFPNSFGPLGFTWTVSVTFFRSQLAAKRYVKR
jgi:hypothetical protein